MADLNHAFFTSSVAGAKAAQDLISHFGDLSNFQQVAAGYFDAYYTEAEKAATQQIALTESLDTLGLTLPETLQGFRSLVEGQDLSTEAGRETYAALLNLSGEFAHFQSVMENMPFEQWHEYETVLARELEMHEARRIAAEAFQAATEDATLTQSAMETAVVSLTEAEDQLEAARDETALATDSAIMAETELAATRAANLEATRQAAERARSALESAFAASDAFGNSQESRDALQQILDEIKTGNEEAERQREEMIAENERADLEPVDESDEDAPDTT